MREVKFTELKDGFEVKWENNKPVQVKLLDGGKGLVIYQSEQIWGHYRTNLYAYRTICEKVLSNLVTNSIYNNFLKKCKPTSKIHRRGYWQQGWYRGTVGKYIGKELHGHWKNLLTKVDPEILEIERRLFYGGGTKIVRPFDFWIWGCHKDQNIRADIKKYAVAATWYTEHMDFWRDTLNPRKNRNVNKTLDNLKMIIPLYFLMDLGAGQLTRPLTTKAEIIMASRNGERHLIPRISSEHDEIKAALKVIDAQTGRTRKKQRLSTRKVKDLSSALIYLCDYDEDYNGRSIVTLAERSARWHTQFRQQRTKRKLGIKPEILNASFKRMPEIEGITFLKTVGDLAAESVLMKHCVSSYYDKTIAGQSFIFHVDYEGEKATIEVNQYGQVVQSHGPYNQSNRAAWWGKTQLTQFFYQSKPEDLEVYNKVGKKEEILDIPY